MVTEFCTHFYLILLFGSRTVVLAVSPDLTRRPTDSKHSMPSEEFCSMVRDSQTAMFCDIYKVKSDGGHR